MKQAGAGLSLLRSGFAFMLARPKLMLLGAIPPLVTSVLMILGLVWLGLSAGGIAEAVTPFASGWGDGPRAGFRVLVAMLIVAAGLLVMVMAFTALTLTLGTPIYDKISEVVDRTAGGIVAPVAYPVSVWLPRAIGQVTLTVLQSVGLALLLFGVGLIPVVGTPVAAVVGAMLGGWMVTRDLIGSPLERRGRPTLSDRSAAMKRNKALVLGFGVPLYLLLAIPFVAVLAFPAATAGGTLLARRLVGEPAS